MIGNAINEFIDSTLAERLSCFDFDCHLNLQLNLLFPPLGMLPRGNAKSRGSITVACVYIEVQWYSSGAHVREARQRSTLGKTFWKIYPFEKFW